MFRVKKNLKSQIKLKKSKFLGFNFYIESKEDIYKQLDILKAEFKDASHLVYAYRLKEQGVLKEKFFNDKEPANSAGQPLLYLLQKKEILNCLLVVVRYFGGVKLGVGGLIRAYTQVAQEVLVNNLEKD